MTLWKKQSPKDGELLRYQQQFPDGTDVILSLRRVDDGFELSDSAECRTSGPVATCHGRFASLADAEVALGELANDWEHCLDAAESHRPTTMTQSIPTVSLCDVERIVRRDFQPEDFETVMAMLGEYGPGEFDREPARSRLAALKAANGDLPALRQQIEWLKCDWRDVMSAAEFPKATKLWGRMPRMSEAEKQRIYDEDWRQYETWLKRT